MLPSDHQRYGLQPIRVVLFQRNLTIKAAATEVGLNYSHLVRAVRGHTRPSPIAVERLSGYLGVPAGELFTADALGSHTLGGERRVLPG